MKNSSSAYQGNSFQTESISKTIFSSITTEQLNTVGTVATRYSLVLLLLSFGVFKFYAFEAEAIQPLVANSPFMSWLYRLLSVGQVSALIGAVEIVLAVLIAIKPWQPKLSAYGSFGAVLMFITSLTFLISTPGMWITQEGLPVPSDGGFILKDIVLLGSAMWTAADALIAYNKKKSQL
ncbi:YkgB family protein [Flavobacterium sp. ENC]|uniref:YkgB family protein n=1 Tax=Flavobacterium sp. ENC TaxID=2897330 RepID=UPI001E46D2D5|nr:DUF417 family protein [Flavobacterium sp. ENC]MCD0467014.1 DUF417 family protein [Flavobacterium sp. ENC]